MMYQMYRLKQAARLILLTAAAAVLTAGAAGCDGEKNTRKTPVLSQYDGPFSAVNGSYGGVDDLGRTLPGGDVNCGTPAGALRPDRTVGIFYFLCLGAGDLSGPYDISEILRKDPQAYRSDAAWMAAGGGGAGTPHWWAQPLFGYYTQTDEWVVRRHIQMLSDAGIDYLMLDTSNGTPNTYLRQGRLLLQLLDEYAAMGYRVPQIAYYTNAQSGRTMQEIYRKMYLEYPELQYLWFQWDGKPLMVGKEEEASQEVKETFRIKASQWPNEEKKDDGWPWVEFERNLTDEAVYGLNGRKEVVCVSPAQHAFSWMSTSAFYGGDNRSRSFYSGANHIAEDSVLWGYNFAEQWEWAIAQDPETIFITQWNEWHATRFDFDLADQPLVFVDLATAEYSRDIEPMRGGYGDNYYMQMCAYIQRYKGAAPRVDVGADISIDMEGSFSQWEDSRITAVYLDYRNDTIERASRGYGRERYDNDTGRNDIVHIKAAKDADYLYFYADTAAPLTSPAENNWMTLFLNSGTEENKNWYGYDYAVTFRAAEDSEASAGGVRAALQKCAGGWSWTEVGSVSVKTEGNQLMLAVPRSLLGLTAQQDRGLLNLQFKWADNYEDDNIWSFYTDGDAAPYGRLNYVFSQQKWT